MKKVITYGTFDLLHNGHIRLLERAKALGDYLIVGVTADDFDKTRGKINVQQSLMERVEAVKATGIADKVIVEEYEGQKIDDIKRYDVDVFTVGSDWCGKFDYIQEYCKVIYLPRTEGISSSEIRTGQRKIKIGVVGESISVLNKFLHECEYVNGIEVAGAFIGGKTVDETSLNKCMISNSYEEMVEKVDALYIVSHPAKHYQQIKYALQKGKHVLCEMPIALKYRQCLELHNLAKEKKCVLMDAVKTAYSTAYSRMVLMLKGGKIGKVVSVDATCTSLKMLDVDNEKYFSENWNSICAWGPTAMLPVFQILGVAYKQKRITSALVDEKANFDIFTKVSFDYEDATATIKVGKGVKSEGELIVTGTKGYIYVPAPWWKTDYFEIRYENPNDNQRYFYQLEGEGIRYEIVAFLRSIENNAKSCEISQGVSVQICSVIEDYESKIDFHQIMV